MFVIIILIILFLCVSSVFLTYKILEIQKDLDTLYDNYSKQLEKLIVLNIERGN